MVIWKALSYVLPQTSHWFMGRTLVAISSLGPPTEGVRYGDETLIFGHPVDKGLPIKDSCGGGEALRSATTGRVCQTRRRPAGRDSGLCQCGDPPSLSRDPR